MCGSEGVTSRAGVAAPLAFAASALPLRFLADFTSTGTVAAEDMVGVEGGMGVVWILWNWEGEVTQEAEVQSGGREVSQQVGRDMDALGKRLEEVGFRIWGRQVFWLQG